MKRFALAILLFFASIFPAAAQTYYDIDVDLPAYPEMQPVPDSPVYYAPAVDSNYFFYDGLYWDYFNDGWFASTWYNGPWQYVDPIYVPTFVLWVPIRYYRRPPAYFRGWRGDRPPRWGQHWGRDWQDRHNAIYAQRSGNPARAPLPDYQRQFARNNYPRGAQQQALHTQNYGYQPREGVVRQHYQNRGATVQPQNPAARPEGQSRPEGQPRQEGQRDEGRRERR